MGTIKTRRRSDGTEAYQAQVVKKQGGKTVYREARTFDRRAAANAWIKKREKEVASPEGLAAIRSGSPTLADAIDRYIDESLRQIGRTKAQVLRSIKSYEIAERECADISSSDIYAFARELGQTRKPQTVSNYLSHLRAVFATSHRRRLR